MPDGVDNNCTGSTNYKRDNLFSNIAKQFDKAVDFAMTSPEKENPLPPLSARRFAQK